MLHAHKNWPIKIEQVEPLSKKMQQALTSLKLEGIALSAESLAKWINQEETRRQMTLEALADVDTGRVTDHEKVKAWADSL